jgi:hypothetical protein
MISLYANGVTPLLQKLTPSPQPLLSSNQHGDIFLQGTTDNIDKRVDPRERRVYYFHTAGVTVHIWMIRDQLGRFRSYQCQNFFIRNNLVSHIVPACIPPTPTVSHELTWCHYVKDCSGARSLSVDLNMEQTFKDYFGKVRAIYQSRVSSDPIYHCTQFQISTQFDDSSCVNPLSLHHTMFDDELGCCHDSIKPHITSHLDSMAIPSTVQLRSIDHP